MDLIPDWAPNFHPLVVHFPIALLFTAVFLDVAALIRRESRVLREIPIILYTLGTVSTAVAYFTGRYASDHVEIPTQAIAVVNKHADLALYTLLLFGAYTLVRIFLTFRVRSDKLWLRLLLVAVPLVGLRLVLHTAEHGAELVFRLGVGVAAAAENLNETEQPAQSGVPDSILVSEDGSWNWSPGAGAIPVLRNQFEFLDGSLDSASVSATDSGLVIDVDGQRLLFTTGDDVAGLEMSATLDVTDFEGEILLIHNVTGPEDYDYFGLSGDMYIHGQARSGQRSSFGSSASTGSKTSQFRSVSSGRHYRGYADGELVTHGHAAAAPPGTMGLLIEGTGRVRLSRIGSTTVN